MKYFIWFLLLPLAVNAQNQSKGVVYTKTYAVNGVNASKIVANSEEYVKTHGDRFFEFFSYTKLPIDSTIDTTGYGFYAVSGDTVKAHTVYVYLTGKNNNCDVMRGEILFIAKDHEAMVLLRDLRYFEYDYIDGKLILQKQGFYKDLDICHHCNVSGIKLGEMVNRNFGRIALSYHKFLKKKE